jgi:hypothetical protein
MHHEGDGRLSKSIWGQEPIRTPERKLWRAVLTQAFEDAEATSIDYENGLEPFESSRARQYLRADNLQEAEHFKLVCEYADIPSDRVILWARQRYPAEQALENHGESGRAAAAFLAAEPFARSEKRELCSRTPQNAGSPQAVTPA